MQYLPRAITSLVAQGAVGGVTTRILRGMRALVALGILVGVSLLAAYSASADTTTNIGARTFTEGSNIWGNTNMVPSKGFAQSFTLTSSGVFTGFDLVMQYGSGDVSIVHTFEWEVRDLTGSGLPGTVLRSGDFTLTMWQANGPTPIHVDLITPISPVTSGEKYAIALKRVLPNPTPDTFFWTFGEDPPTQNGLRPNPYDDGEAFEENSPDIWTAMDPPQDFRMTVHVKQCVQAPPNIDHWWPFDETAGLSAADIIGLRNGNTKPGAIGLPGNPASVPGKVGNAFQFDGSSAFVEVPDGPGILSYGNPGQEFSIDAWIKVKPEDKSGILPIVDKRNEIGGKVAGYELFLYEGNLGFQLADASVSNHDCDGNPTSAPSPTTSCTNYVSNANVADGLWHHVAVTVERTGTSPRVRLYVDGALKLTGPTRIHANNSAALLMGKNNPAVYASGQIFKGLIDELEIFGRALPQSDLLSIVNADIAGKCKPVVKDIHKYCISGTSTGVGWTWTVIIGSSVYSGVVLNGAVPPGGTAVDLAFRWVDSMIVGGVNDVGVPPSQFSEPQANCFQIPGLHTLTVDSCTVTHNPSGCSFNPTVHDVTNVGGTTELLVGRSDTPDTPGSAADSSGGSSFHYAALAGSAAAAAAAMGAWYVRRRFRQRRI